MKVRFPHGVSRSLTLRTTVVLWLGSIFLVWTALVASWFIVKHWSVDSQHAALSTGIDAINASHRLEVALLGYRREDLLWHATGNNDYAEPRDEYLRAAGEAMKGLVPYADTPDEKATESHIQEAFQALAAQIDVGGSTPPATEVQLSEETLAAVGDFRSEEEMQMERSINEADHLYAAITYWMVGLSAGTAVLLFVGALRFVRRVIRPVLALTRSAEAFGQGNMKARVPVLHDDELSVLARTFNNMATDISNREEERLRFVAMVAHDLKNPVHAIQMALRALGGPQVSEEDRQFYVGGAMEETERLKRIIRDITEDTQVATGRFSIHRRKLDLAALVRRLMESQGEARATHEVVVETSAGCIVLADAERMERVVVNLFSNAIKYSPPDTRVIVRVARKDSYVQLAVSDQGPGIAKEDLPIIFQPFGRGRSAGTLAEGAGMGLYVVRQIVQAHEGRIEVRSEPGHGTTFLIELPLAPTLQPA